MDGNGELKIDAVTLKNMEERAKWRELEIRQESCAWKYINKHDCLAEFGDKVIEAFYSSDEPEALMDMELSELVKLAIE